MGGLEQNPKPVGKRQIRGAERCAAPILTTDEHGCRRGELCETQTLTTKDTKGGDALLAFGVPASAGPQGGTGILPVSIRG
jgi:hypothetical protein